MLISIPYSIGFLLIGFASHSSMLYIGRILDGCMIGFSAPSAQIFVCYFKTVNIACTHCNCSLTHSVVDWRMCVASSTWSFGRFHSHFPFSGNSHYLYHRRFRSLERSCLDSCCIPCSSLCCHVFYARNSVVAFVQESRRRS